MTTKTFDAYTIFYYRRGGNPPVAAGMFDRDGNRIAWWPAGYSPTHENMEKVMALVIAREDDKPVSRDAIREALKEQEIG